MTKGNRNANRRSNSKSDGGPADGTSAADKGADALTASTIIARTVARLDARADKGADQSPGEGASVVQLPPPMPPSPVMPIIQGWVKMMGAQIHGYAPVKHEGIIAGEIIGWRSWCVEQWPDGPRLRSVFWGTLWETDAPMYGEGLLDGGRGGVHAWKTLKDAQRYARGHWGFGLIVVGSVKLWGEVIEHDIGYRAEWAKPRSFEEAFDGIDRLLDADHLLEDLRKTYGV